MPGDAARQPTSAILDRLLESAPPDRVTIGWLVSRLGRRSFGIVMLLMALIGLIPGASTIMGVVLAVPAIQIMLARDALAFPGFVARRSVATPRLAALIRRLVPVLRRMERVIRSRWHTPFAAAKRGIGFAVLLLGAAMVVPVPFGHVIPAFLIMLLSLALLQEDGILLAIALVGAVAALAAVGAAVWATVLGIDFLDRL